VATLYGATFGSNTVIQPGALVAFDINNNYTLTLNGILTNRGTLRQVANWYTSTLAGTGSIENEGLMDLTVGNGGSYQASEATIELPVKVAAGGRLLLNTNGYLRVLSTDLTVAGTLEIQAGARLRLQNDGAPRDLALQDGAILQGDGETRLEGVNRLYLAGHTTLAGGSLNLVGSTTVGGPGLLTILAKGTLSIDHSLTIPGSVDNFGALVIANNSTTLSILGTLTLESGGLLNNPGTVKTHAYLNIGGTIIGNAPIGGALMSDLSIGLALSNGRGSTEALAPSVTGPGRTAVLTWTGPPAATFVLETSADVQHWVPAATTVREIIPGRYQAVIGPGDRSAAFFRFKLAY